MNFVKKKLRLLNAKVNKATEQTLDNDYSRPREIFKILFEYLFEQQVSETDCFSEIYFVLLDFEPLAFMLFCYVVE